ncbi:AAA family ATPase [Puia dinghuensis]|uniref:AAA+ ATPase domain-containing protein n=1 Tax=Puia dinghuensis TaxID=1792502 RepID=A0A8J2XSX6_9BACT|nr:AAA family ATPase [Puia dinghuensis]GGB12961.1 hypothetical protein GCM10011511_40760 [Puia dinghuensis]
MDNLYNQRVINANNLFGDQFLDAKTLYLYCFNQLPSVNYINWIDGEKAYVAFKEKFASRIVRIHQYRWYKHKKKQYQFDITLVVMDNECLIEFDDGYCEIWHNGKHQEFIDEVTTTVYKFKQRSRRQPLEINLIVSNRNNLELKPMEIKRTKLDLDLFYNKDFKEVDALIRQRLGKKKDKGIVLLHGLPGTGKTTYLRYLIGKIKKRVLFLSPSVADNLMNPDFIQLLINNPDTVVIIEDAENIIMDRKHSPGSSVSNLLNISDGLLADFLNIQLVCTFNNSLTLIDEALMRKGRLIAKYEFGKLTMDQSQRLSDHLGFEKVITRPMTIAEIANQHEKQQAAPRMEVIGFRRHLTDTTHSLA